MGGVLTSKQEVEETLDGQGRKQLKETKDAFYEFVFITAARDTRRGGTVGAILRQVKEELVSSDEAHASEAANLGRRLATNGKPSNGVLHNIYIIKTFTVLSYKKLIIIITRLLANNNWEPTCS